MSVKKHFMKKSSRAIVFVTILTIATILIIAQNRNDEDVISAEQVSKSIQSFIRLVTPQTAESFGLKSADQLKDLKAGRQFKKYMIGLEDVRNFKPETNVNTIIKELEAVEVSLVDQAGQVQTGIEFTRERGKWEPSAFGLSIDLKRLKDAQVGIPDSVIKSSRLVVIPALRTTFLMQGEGASSTFYILENNDRLEFRKGIAIPAADALQKLKVVANEYNGLPD